MQTLTSEQFLDGPWDLASKDQGDQASVFVSNALSGTVTRLDLEVRDDPRNPIQVEAKTQIASGYMHRCDPAAFLVGPTGLALNPADDTLYVASTGDNEIFAITPAVGKLTQGMAICSLTIRLTSMGLSGSHWPRIVICSQHKVTL